MLQVNAYGSQDYWSGKHVRKSYVCWYSSSGKESYLGGQREGNKQCKKCIDKNPTEESISFFAFYKHFADVRQRSSPAHQISTGWNTMCDSTNRYEGKHKAVCTPKSNEVNWICEMKFKNCSVSHRNTLSDLSRARSWLALVIFIICITFLKSLIWYAHENRWRLLRCQICPTQHSTSFPFVRHVMICCRNFYPEKIAIDSSQESQNMPFRLLHFRW